MASIKLHSWCCIAYRGAPTWQEKAAERKRRVFGEATGATFSWICLTEEFDLFPDSRFGHPCRDGAFDDNMVALSAYPLSSILKGKALPTAGIRAPMAIRGDVHLRVGVVTLWKQDERFDARVLEHQFWERLADARVLVSPGWFSSPVEAKAPSINADRQIGHIYLCYTPSSVCRFFMRTVRTCCPKFWSPQLKTTSEGAKIFAQTLRDFSRV